MLLNLSNHPSHLWPENQKRIAIEKYGGIQDLLFPQIDPKLEGNDLNQLVDEYVLKVKKINPECVHIMGELTFTYRMVKRLKALGINCIASTTERKVSINNNQKISEFQFVRFRPY